MALALYVCSGLEHFIWNHLPVSSSFWINKINKTMMSCVSNTIYFGIGTSGRCHQSKPTNNFFQIQNSVHTYKINWNRTEATPLHCMTSPIHLGTAQTVWKKELVKYLGINESPQINKMFEMNGATLIKTIRKDLTRRGALPLSLLEEQR